MCCLASFSKIMGVVLPSSCSSLVYSLFFTHIPCILPSVIIMFLGGLVPKQFYQHIFLSFSFRFKIIIISFSQRGVNLVVHKFENYFGVVE